MTPTRNFWVSGRGDRIQVREMRKLHDKLLKQQMEFRDSGEWQKHLARSLEHFQRRDCMLTVELLDKPHDLAPSPCGKKSLERVLGYENVLECVPPTGSVHNIEAIETVLRARCQLVGLSLTDHFTRLQRKTLDVMNHMVVNSTFAHFEPLVRLNLLLDYPATVDHAATLALVLNALPHLEHLRLRGRRHWGAPQIDTLQHITTQASLAVLDTLKISFPLITRQSLINFIEKHKQTLQQVTVFVDRVWERFPDLAGYEQITACIKGHHSTFRLAEEPSRNSFF